MLLSNWNKNKLTDGVKMDQTGIKIRSQTESRWTKSIFLRVGVEGVNPCLVSISVRQMLCWHLHVSSPLTLTAALEAEHSYPSSARTGTEYRVRGHTGSRWPGLPNTQTLLFTSPWSTLQVKLIPKVKQSGWSVRGMRKASALVHSEYEMEQFIHAKGDHWAKGWR